MIGKVKKAISKYGMLERGDKVVVALSGGPDSVALLKVLEILSPDYGITLIAAHLNHGIRGQDADNEELFVKRLCNSMGIVFESKKVDLFLIKEMTGMSMEEIGREERYKFLKEVAIKHQAKRVAIGHHFNDQVETVLINIIRGSAIEGLKGMLPVRDDMFIRPLLDIRKEEILDFLRERQISYNIDKSNYENTYLRNRIRKDLISSLKSENPNIEKTLFNMATIIRIEDDYMIKVTDDIFSSWDMDAKEDEFKIKISDFKACHDAIQGRLIKRILQKYMEPGKALGHAHIMSVKNLIHGKKIRGNLNLPSGVNILKVEDDLYIYRRNGSRRFHDKVSSLTNEFNFYYPVSIPGTLKIPQINKMVSFELFSLSENPVDFRLHGNSVAFMDYDKIIQPIVLRSTRPGDRIQPLGMAGTKKIKSCFINDKIKQERRKQIPLLLDQESVIWIMGIRMSERVKISQETRTALRVEIV